MKNKIIKLRAEYLQSLVFLTFGLLALFALYLPRLGSFISGSSLFEQASFLGVTSKQLIFENIAFGPLKIAQAIMVKIDDPNVTILRLLSTACVITAVLSLYFILERWHTRRIALLGSVLFATSSYSLHQARFAGHEVLYLLAIPLIVVIGIWLRSKHHVTKLPIGLVIAGLLLYIPGLWVLILPLAILFRKRLLLAWKFVGIKARIAGVLGLLFTTAPLAYSLIRFPAQLPTFIGYDRLANHGVTAVLKQYYELPKQLVATGPNEPIKWLTGTPILDVATIAFIILGVYSYFRGQHTLRARLLGLLAVLSMVIISASIHATVALILPLLYILAANGLAYLLQSWFTVFPKNPAARTLGIVLVAAVVGVVASYHIKRYYVAWPNSPETKQVLQTPIRQVVQ